MSHPYNIGDNVTVHTCSGLFDVTIRGLSKSIHGEREYDCTGHKQGQPRNYIITTTSARSIVGSPEYVATCESDCPFRKHCSEFTA